MPVNILASRRANAAEDLLVESSQKAFTVLAGDRPVPMAYTKTLNRGQSNVVVVAGRNLANCRLEFDSAEGPLFLDQQQGDERAIFGIASLDMETTASLNLAKWQWRWLFVFYVRAAFSVCVVWVAIFRMVVISQL